MCIENTYWNKDLNVETFSFDILFKSDLYIFKLNIYFAASADAIYYCMWTMWIVITTFSRFQATRRHILGEEGYWPIILHDFFAISSVQFMGHYALTLEIFCIKSVNCSYIK